MTHILIPIAQLEAEIKHNREYLNGLERNERSNDSDKLEQRTEFLEDLLTGKQISLDEKNIGDKAVAQSLKFASTAPEDYSLGYIDGYKQLIKDLL